MRGIKAIIFFTYSISSLKAYYCTDVSERKRCCSIKESIRYTSTMGTFVPGDLSLCFLENNLKGSLRVKSKALQGLVCKEMGELLCKIMEWKGSKAGENGRGLELKVKMRNWKYSWEAGWCQIVKNLQLYVNELPNVLELVNDRFGTRDLSRKPHCLSKNQSFYFNHFWYEIIPGDIRQSI